MSVDVIVLANQLVDSSSGIEQIEFSDGTVWSRGRIMQQLVPMPASTTTNSVSAGQDVIDGSIASDVLSGNGGSEFLRGGLGADTYLFNSGDGNVTIVDHGIPGEMDKILFGPGFLLSELVITRLPDSPNSITLGFFGSTDSLTITDFRGESGDGIEIYEFSDGTRISTIDLVQLHLSTQNTAGTDIAVGSDLDETIITGDGDDFILGGAGNDFLDGQDGDDTYYFNLV